jgi:hypothetical protein
MLKQSQSRPAELHQPARERTGSTPTVVCIRVAVLEED